MLSKIRDKIYKSFINNLAPISFFTLVIIAFVGISVSNRSNQTKVDLLISQAEQIQKDIDKYDNFLLYKYSVKTEDYKSFANDVKELTQKLEQSRDNISPSPNDDEGTQLREDLKLLLNFKIDTYKKISFDLEPYTDILEDRKNIGTFERVVLNTDKITREKRLEELSKMSESSKKIFEFYNQKRNGEPKLLEKVKIDTDFITKAYESLRDNPEIEPKLLEEIKTNFGPGPDGEPQWPTEIIQDYVLDTQILALNETQKPLSYVKDSLKIFKAKYHPDRLQDQSQPSPSK